MSNTYRTVSPRIAHLIVSRNDEEVAGEMLASFIRGRYRQGGISTDFTVVPGKAQRGWVESDSRAAKQFGKKMLARARRYADRLAIEEGIDDLNEIQDDERLGAKPRADWLARELAWAVEEGIKDFHEMDRMDEMVA